MSAEIVKSHENQGATFVELFFDLVFVFSVTQVVRLLAHGLEEGHHIGEAIGQSALVFWLVWWAWSQFTWGLNAADTTHQSVQLGTLLATAVAFLMAVALPEAFHERALWFAIPYVVVRLIGLGLGYWVAQSNPAQQQGVRTFALMSMVGMVTVILGAIVGGTGQFIFWMITIVLDIVAAAISGQNEGWDLRPEHFGERHGLFVIIALGETLIIAAGGVTGEEWTGELLLLGILAVAVTCALWWSYFAKAKPVIDEALETSQGAEQSTMARDVYSLIHYPMLCGVIAFAAALEIAVVHPGDPLHRPVQIALAVGVLLFVGGMALGMFRATRYLALPRIIITIVTALAVVVVSDVSPALSLGIVFVGIVAIAVLEQQTLGSAVEQESDNIDVA